MATKTVRAQVNTRIRELKNAMRSDQALRYFEKANIREHELRAANPRRPVVQWTHRVVLTSEQTEAFMRMSGWEILGTIYHLVDDQYALVARASDGSCYGVLYPTGELERSTKRREFDLRSGNWNASRKTQTTATKPPVIAGAREMSPSGPVRANGMWESLQVFAPSK